MPRAEGTVARGYGPAHKRERARWVPLVEAGQVACWRCGRLILPGSKWDLGHDDHDRSVYRGPEHANRCNRSAGGVKGNRSPKRRGRRRPRLAGGVFGPLSQ